MKCYVGIDPDLHNTGIAVLAPDGTVLDVAVARVPLSIKGYDAATAMAVAMRQELSLLQFADSDPVTIEGQHVTFRTKKPESILLLALVAGAALGLCAPCARVVTAKTWKGQTPKPISQQRILKKLGWEFERKKEYCVPTGPPVGTRLRDSDWKHVLDAIGLAQWRLSKG